jgi:hypothetical protein
MADGKSVYCRPCKRDAAKAKPTPPQARPDSGASIATPAIKRPAGRPTKLTPEIIGELVGVLERGHTRRAAAAMAGLAESTVRQWLADAREDNATPLQRELLRSIEQAEGVGEYTLVELVRDSAAIDPNAAKWLLERRHSIDWARKENLSVTTADKPADVAVLRELITKRIDGLIAARSSRGSEGSSGGSNGDPTAGDAPPPPISVADPERNGGDPSGA